MDVLGVTARLADPLTPYVDVDRLRPAGPCWVVANMVGGLDGSAAIGGRVAALSTAPDAALFLAMRTLADVVLVGAETIRREGYGPLLLPRGRAAARRAAGKPGSPRLAIVSRSLDLDWTGRAFTDPALDQPPYVVTCQAADRQRLARASQVAEVVLAGDERVDPALALEELARRGATVVLTEGGPTLLGELVAGGHLDELLLTVSPLMGGDPLPVAVAPPGAPLTGFALRHVLREADTLFLRYERAEADRGQ
ncbi:dihydrofolate reductase family protein [Nocardioides jiangxiensis]|uniref:Dihydrofolate reductase family protein n=1 Tax=Nocardioides jiangxiensis TaxID=3064524 RepID=A0ABT9B2G0_9ACTN|nr:dihydrofolate reductase family protein [Nocardioides sp. WY-20]MDO7867348.1 dihydrofolate reductase family protein [Nocardioides sp. WY-20]